MEKVLVRGLLETETDHADDHSTFAIYDFVKYVLLFTHCDSLHYEE
jgi:hypothetical protein